MSFLGSMLTAKARDLHDAAVKTVANWDPNGAGESQIIEWDSQAKEFAASAAKAATDATAANDEVANINANITRYIAAAEKLAATNETAAMAAATTAEEWQARLADAQNVAKDATSWAAETLAAAQLAQKKVMDGRKTIEAAKRDLARATQENQIAEQRRAERERMAGITKGLNGADLAIDALTANAKEAREKAAANNIRSGVLGANVENDAAINAALAEVDGGPKPQTLAEKLAALKQHN